MEPEYVASGPPGIVVSGTGEHVTVAGTSAGNVKMGVIAWLPMKPEDMEDQH